MNDLDTKLLAFEAGISPTKIAICQCGTAKHLTNWKNLLLGIGDIKLKGRPDEDTGLDMNGVVRILGCRPGLVRKLVRAGKAENRRDGRLLTFARENVDGYVRSLEKEGAKQRRPQQRKRGKFNPVARHP